MIEVYMLFFSWLIDLEVVWQNIFKYANIQVNTDDGMILKKFYLCAFFVLFAFSYFYGLNKDFWRFFFFCVQDFILFLLLYCKIKTKAYLILIIIASENNYYYLGKGYAHVAISNARYKRPLWSLCGSYKINALIDACNTMCFFLLKFEQFTLVILWKIQKST